MDEQDKRVLRIKVGLPKELGKMDGIVGSHSKNKKQMDKGRNIR